MKNLVLRNKKIYERVDYMKKTHHNILRRYIALVIALFMVIQTVHISGLVSRAADVTITIQSSTGVVTIDDPSKTYYISGWPTTVSDNTAIVIDVGAGNTVNIMWGNTDIIRPLNGDGSTHGAVIQVRSGNAVFTPESDTTSCRFYAPLQQSVGSALSIAEGSTVTFKGGSYLLYGAQQSDGDAAIKGGKLILDDGAVVKAGKKIDGTKVEVKSGVLYCNISTSGETLDNSIELTQCIVGTGGEIVANEITLPAGATFTNEGTVNATVISAAEITNSGEIDSITNTSTFTNEGTISSLDNTSTGVAVNNGTISYVDNSGTFTNNNVVYYTLTNNGNATNTGEIRGTVNNNGEFKSMGTSPGTVYLTGGQYKMTYDCAITELNQNAGSVKLDKTQVNEMQMTGMTADKVHISDCSFGKLAGSDSDITVGGSSVYADTLDVANIKAESASTTIKIFDRYTNNHSGISEDIASGKIIVVVEPAAVLANEVLVVCEDVKYHGINMSGNLSSSFSENVTYDIGTGVSVSSQISNHKVNEDIMVTVTADDGYYLPDDYEVSFNFDVEATDHSPYESTDTVVMTGNKKCNATYSVSDGVGVYSNERSALTIVVPDATPKEAQPKPAVLAGALKLVGTTSQMEYAASPTASTWITCGDTETSVEPGLWYVRYKETYSNKAEEVLELEIIKKAYLVDIVGNGTVAKTVDTGEASQYCIENTPMVSVTYRALDGYYFPEDYTVEVGKGITVTRKDLHSITISGIPSEDVTVKLPDASRKFMALIVPSDVYTISATKGKNNYYITGVTVHAKDGYLVSKEADGKYTESVTFNETSDGETVYFMDTATGFTSPGIKIDGFLIDKKSPATSLQDGKTYYGKNKEITIEDEHLYSVTVNKENVEIVGNKATIELSSDGGEEEYEIIAKDYAGNETVIKVKVAAEWTKNKVIPIGEKVKLTTDKEYTLGEGNWNVEGDSTTYKGGNSFYIKEEGIYTFTKNE